MLEYAPLEKIALMALRVRTVRNADGVRGGDRRDRPLLRRRARPSEDASGSRSCCRSSGCTPPSTATRSSPAPARSRSSSAFPGGRLPCAGVTVVGVLPTHRRRGILDRMMRAQLADIRERGEPIAALWASEETIYGRFGYGLASLGRDDPARSRVHAALRADAAGRAGTTRLVGHDEALSVFPRDLRPRPQAVARASSRARGLVGAAPARRPPRAPARRRRAQPRAARAGRQARRLCPLPHQARVRGRDATTSQVQVLEAIGDSPARDPGALALPARRSTGSTRSAVSCSRSTIRCSCSCSGPTVSTGRSSTASGCGSSTSARRSRPARRRATAASPSTCTRDPILPDNVGTWTVEAGAARRSRRRADVRLDVQALGGGIPRRLHVRRARPRRARRGGCPRRHRPRGRALPGRREAMVPGDILTLAIV